MNKKAEEEGTGISGKIVALILMIAVVFVAYYLIASYYSSDPLGIFPDYILDENVVQYDGREKLLHPGLIVYYIYGTNANIYFVYQTNSDFYKPGWYWQVSTKGYFWWSKSKYLGWITVDWNKAHDFGKLTDANKNMIRSLRGKSPEEGLRLLAKRVVANKVGNWWYHAEIRTHIGKGESKIDETYKAKDASLKDIDRLIIEINQRTRGYLNE
jgi:hypothetical protein